MNHPNKENLTTKIKRLINLALGITLLDGGTVIGIQIISFLLTYFYILQAHNKINSLSLIVPLISILNLSVIIYRITWLTRGVKHSLNACYLHALLRWPLLILLYILGDLLLLSLAKPILKLFVINNQLAIFMIFALIPYGLLACIFIVDQNKNPLQAIIATYNAIRYKINFNLLLVMSILYGIPCLLSSILATSDTFAYITLMMAVWLLFCHILTIVIYVDSLDSPEFIKSQSKNKATKVVII